MDPNKSKRSFKYLWVGKVWGATKKLGFPKLLWRFWTLKVQNWPKCPKPYRWAYRAKQDHFSTQFEVLSMNLTQKVQILHVEGPIGPKIGSNWSKIDPKGQNHIGGPKEPNKTSFPLSLKP